MRRWSLQQHICVGGEQTALVKARGKDTNVTERQMMRTSIRILAVGFDRNCHICDMLCRKDMKYQGTTRLWAVNRRWYPSYTYKGERDCHLSQIRHLQVPIGTTTWDASIYCFRWSEMMRLLWACCGKAKYQFGISVTKVTVSRTCAYTALSRLKMH